MNIVGDTHSGAEAARTRVSPKTAIFGDTRKTPVLIPKVRTPESPTER
jgi:hypothetical protein